MIFKIIAVCTLLCVLNKFEINAKIMSVLGYLNGIYIYPVKSLPGIFLDKAYVTSNGLAHSDNIQVVDRKWMVVDENYSFLSQRKLPKMALIHQRLSGDYLILSAPDKLDLKVSIKTPEIKVKSRLWTKNIDCFLYPRDISKWLSDFLGESVNLVSLGEQLEQRNCKEADFNTFMLVSEASLSELNSRLRNKVTMKNFRPNFIASNCSAFAEDNWSQFKISDVEFFKSNYCVRCLFTTIDPDRGIKCNEQEPLRTLKDYRMNTEIDKTAPLFGIYLNVSNSTDSSTRLISIGDQIKSN